ncbi:MAG: hypothetical protein M3440_07290, partial [Chloroflexota bacterium]|nr:hypothetical protein [Chloroflexota bacterium]
MAAWIRFAYTWTSASAYTTEVLSDSPVGYWKLGESSGTVVPDASGNGRAGTNSGATVGATSLVATDTGDTAYSFDGVNDRVTGSSVSGIDLATQDAMSVEYWFRASSITTYAFPFA